MPSPALAPWLTRSLQQLLACPSHAILLHGPSGLGQWQLAQALAASWLCEAPQADGSACGTCSACHLLSVHTHPDCLYLLPEEQMLEWDLPLSEKAQKELDEKKRKASREIRIESMRDAVEFTLRTSARSRGQVLLIYPAERMNTVTANALLKTLEEPSGQVRLLLVSEAADELLPTIRSRCQSFALQWPDAAESTAYLQRLHPKLDNAQLQQALAACGGRPLDAAEWLNSSLPQRWAALPRALAAGTPGALADMQPKQALDTLQKLYHDLWAVKVQGQPRFFAVQDLPRPPTAAALEQWGRQLRALALSIEHPYKADLLLENLAAQAAAVLCKSVRPAV